jgi:isopentenyl phosphate kinase
MKGSGLNKPELTVLKIGGSVITHKKMNRTPRIEEINRLAQEIHSADHQNLIIVHGGGSFGHPLAKKYMINEGFKDACQKIGFCKTHYAMTNLNGLFMDSLILHGVEAVSTMPSSCVITEDGRIKKFEDSSIRALLKMGFKPVLYGDAVLDSKRGFSILSGDQLVTSLAIRLEAERIIIGVDVDGLYEEDPKTTRKPRMLQALTLKELKQLHGKLSKPNTCDVTGGIFGKVTELLPAVENGIQAVIVNASKPDNIRRVLKGKKVKGTIIEGN